MAGSNETSVCAESRAVFTDLLTNALTQQDRQRVLLHVKNCPACASALLAQQHSHTSNVVASAPKDTGWLIKLAWVLIIGAGLVIGGFLLWDLGIALWFDRSQPMWLRAALGIFYAGFALLFLAILRERLTARKTDKFRKVKQ